MLVLLFFFHFQSFRLKRRCLNVWRLTWLMWFFWPLVVNRRHVSFLLSLSLHAHLKKLLLLLKLIKLLLHSQEIAVLWKHKWRRTYDLGSHHAFLPHHHVLRIKSSCKLRLHNWLNRHRLCSLLLLLLNWRLQDKWSWLRWRLWTVWLFTFPENFGLDFCSWNWWLDAFLDFGLFNFLSFLSSRRFSADYFSFFFLPFTCEVFRLWSFLILFLSFLAFSCFFLLQFFKFCRAQSAHSTGFWLTFVGFLFAWKLLESIVPVLNNGACLFLRLLHSLGTLA